MTHQLRTSERKTFKECPQRWWWAYREGLKPKGSEATPLWFGTGVHLGLALWYLPGTKRGIHPAETFSKFAGDSLHAIKVADADEERVAEYEDGKKLGEVLLQEYIEHYGRDEQWSFIQAEKTFRLPIPWPSNDRQAIYDLDDSDLDVLTEYVGTWDGAYRDLDTVRLELLETKTAASIQLAYLTLDDQAGSYWAIATAALREEGLIGPKEFLSGINYNFLRKALPDLRPKDAEGYATNKPVKADYLAQMGDYVNPKMKLEEMQAEAKRLHRTVLGERSKVQPLPLFHREMVHRTSRERTTQLRRIQDEALQMRVVRDGLLPVIKKTSRDCPRCQFFAMCELQERGGNWEDHKAAAYRVEDPYADHRKSAEE
jgi:hypothetical protein